MSNLCTIISFSVKWLQGSIQLYLYMVECCTTQYPSRSLSVSGKAICIPLCELNANNILCVCGPLLTFGKVVEICPADIVWGCCNIDIHSFTFFPPPPSSPSLHFSLTGGKGSLERWKSPTSLPTSQSRYAAVPAHLYFIRSYLFNHRKCNIRINGSVCVI